MILNISWTICQIINTVSYTHLKGIKDNEAKELKEKVALVKSRVVTEATKQNAIERIKKYFAEKGYSNLTVDIAERPDTTCLLYTSRCV